jgi:hypothetical protein
MSAKIFHHTPKLPRFTSLGGYPIMYVESGDVLCADCATEWKHENPEGQLDRDIYWEGEPELCSNCYVEIESAYGPVEE